MSYDPEKPFPELDSSDPDTQLIYFLVEPFHVPPLGYSKLLTTSLYRKQALRMLQKFRTYGEGDSVVSYLALTYFDNFIGHHKLPAKIAERRDRILIVVGCCFILASKKRNPEFCPYDFLKKQQLNHMEEIIDEIGPVVDIKLEHRKIMEPVTAVCFLDYLTGILAMDENVRETIKSFATHKLHAYHTDTRSTEFLPSIVAAVAIFSSVRTFYESAASCPIFKFLQCKHIDRVLPSIEGKLLQALGVFFPNFTVPIPHLSEPSSPPPENLHKTADDENVTSEIIVESSGGNEINMQIAERSNRLAAAKSRGRALIAAMAQCDLVTTKPRSPPPENRHRTNDDETTEIIVESSGGNEINLAERSNILLNKLAAAKSRRRALIAAIAQCDLLTTELRLSQPDHSNGSTTETTKLRVLPPDYNHGSETGTAKVKVPTTDRSHGSHTDIAKVKVPILVTAAEQDPDTKLGTSSDSSENVREDNGSSANTALLQVPAPDRSPGQNLDTDNRPMIVNADAQGTSYIMIGSIPVRIPPPQIPEFTNSRIITIGSIPIRIPIDNSDITGHTTPSHQISDSANSENVNTNNEANIVPAQNPADENATNEVKEESGDVSPNELELEENEWYNTLHPGLEPYIPPHRRPGAVLADLLHDLY